MDSSKRTIESIQCSKAVTPKRYQSKTIRLTINLKQTDKNGCAVFNYQELLKAEKEKLNIVDEQNGNFDVYCEDEEALKKIALQYEKKYGKRYMRYQSYTELGAGYDESDSFIDNSEQYEEDVPDDVEPKMGGYYINRGVLEYKKKEESIDLKRSKKKRPMETESEEDETSSEAKKSTKVIAMEGRNEKTEKLDDSESKLLNGRKKNKSKKLLKIKKTEEVSKDSTKTSREKTNKMYSRSNSSDTKGPSASNESSCIAADANDVSAHIEIKAEIIGEITDQLDEKEIDALKTQNDMPKIENDSEDTYEALSSETSNSGDRDVYRKDDPPKLPEISSELLVIINELKNLAGNFKNSQRKFFNGEAISLFYRLESTCRKELNCSDRNAVYSYIANLLPFIRKSTLISRIKKIFVGNGQLETFLISIKKIVSSVKMKDDGEMQRQSLEEVRPFLKKIFQIKVRQYLVMPVKKVKKNDSLEAYIFEFLLNDIIPIWPTGSVTVNNLHNLVLDAIRMEAESYNLTYSPRFYFVKDSTTPVTTVNEILSSQHKKIGCQQDDDLTIISKTGTSGNTSECGIVVSRDLKQKDDTQLSPLNINSKERDVTLVMKVSHKKQRNTGSKQELGKWSQQVGKKIDRRFLDREIESRDKCVTKFCSTDEKVQMQLDQVMQDLVVLNQMSSDNTSSTNSKEKLQMATIQFE